MAAVITPTSTPAPAPWHHPPSARPQLRVLPGGPAAVRAQRRRGAGVARPGATAVLAGLVTAAVVALALVGLAHLLGADAAASGPASTAQSSPAAGGASPSAPVEASAGAPTAASAVADHVVVAPGDTLWSIARTLQPSGDVRPLVDRLAARAGGPVLAVGQRIDVTGLA